MLTKVLVANRGEIAVRVIRACRELGIRTVAVYSDADRDARHVRDADEAYALPGTSPADTYLNGAAILDVAERSGADAIHPGYGFLSENAEFAELVAATGVTFVGPSPAAIATMGNKASARIAAARAGVPGVPGIDSAESVDDVVAAGDRFGWPVAIKAAFGGGGRGMKVVATADQAADAFEAARREALSYFGRGDVYVEKYLEWPRHVEVQVLADTGGRMVSLGERDCSCQRRHQKLIEESPAPGIADDVRQAMATAAIAIATSCDYVGAGTVEFLYEDGAFWFLEMNTRIQVEHPVTELVTGIDLVQWQLRIAAGEPLTFRQDDVVPRGHAIEVRLNAEDPANGFAPSPGPIRRFRRPAGPGIRLDEGYDEGDCVSQYYDNLVAKLIAWDESREGARRRMLRALAELEIDGVATTAPAHVVMLAAEQFANASHSTKWVDEQLDLSALAAAAAPGGDVRTGQGHRLVAEIDGRRFEVTVWGDALRLVAEPAAATRVPSQPVVEPGAPMLLTRMPGAVVAPLQGVVVKVLVAEGQPVAAGDAVCLLESMKMENAVTSDWGGVVREVRVGDGDMVAPGDVLVVIES